MAKSVDIKNFTKKGLDLTKKGLSATKNSVEGIKNAEAIKKSSGMFKEFKEFLYEYKVIGLAVAFIIGMAATALVKSLVDNIIMPLITPFIPGGAWETTKVQLGPFLFGLGPFVAALINFVIIAFVVFLIAKKLFKEDKVTKK